MTEAEWLVSPDPMRLMNHLWRGGRPYPVTVRKLRLLVCASLRRIWPLLSEKGRRILEVVERHADQLVPYAELEAANFRYAQCHSREDYAVYYGAFSSSGLRTLLRTILSYAAESVEEASGGESGLPNRIGTAFCPESVAQSRLAREIFRNPFRPVALDSAWLSWQDGLVPRLAQAAYEHRTLPAGTLDNTRLAVLADALEEAGCQNQDILAHCRQPGGHVRGCWVVDLLLGEK
jgi:hypothetical protein